MVGQDLHQAPGVRGMGADGGRQVNPRIRQTPMAHVQAPVRVEFAMGEIIVGVGLEDMGTEEVTGMVEDTFGLIDPVASRCLAAYPSTYSMGKSLFVCRSTKWCTILP